MTSSRRQLRWELSNNVAPSIYFGLDRKLCGIYTLEFEGGDRYVGQTVDLTSRLASHRRRWTDIVAVSFIECGPDELDDLDAYDDEDDADEEADEEDEDKDASSLFDDEDEDK